MGWYLCVVFDGPDHPGLLLLLVWLIILGSLLVVWQEAANATIGSLKRLIEEKNRIIDRSVGGRSSYRSRVAATAVLMAAAGGAGERCSATAMGMAAAAAAAAHNDDVIVDGCCCCSRS